MKQSNFDADMDAARGEFIFVLDRSGSMSGSRIEMAKEALILFLKSLPPQCYFNIISFGDDFKSMHDKSLPADDNSIKDAIRRIEGFKADMGCTEIDDALEFCYKLQGFDHSPKMVFMLTDGDVGNPDSVIKLARIHNKNCRTFTIGVGSGASSYLVREIAKHGRGKHIMIKESNMIAEKVIGLLQVSLSPVLDDFKFKFDEEIVEFMTPGPNTPINILKNEPINMFVFLNEKFN